MGAEALPFGFPVRIDQAVELDELPESDKETHVSEIQIARVGKWKHPVYGELEITEKTLQDFVDNFNKGTRRVELAVDQSHQPEKGAAGWFKKLEKRGKELWAEIEWTPLGVKLLKEKIYRYFSPEFTTTYTDDETGKKVKNVLFGGGLTNRPFIKDMQPVMLAEPAFDEVTNTQEEGEENVKIKLTEEQKKAFGIDADEIELDELKKKLGVKQDDKTGNAGGKGTGDDGNDETDNNTDTGDAQLTETNRQLSEANRLLSERVETLEKKLKESDWQQYRDSKIKEGRLTMALSEKFKDLFLEDPDKAKDIIDALPQQVKLGEIGTSGGSDNEGDKTPADIFLDEVHKYQKEKNVDYAVALQEVTKQKPDLARQYQEFVRAQ